MDTEHGGDESLCWWVGVGRERLVGGKEDIGNTLNNENFKRRERGKKQVTCKKYWQNRKTNWSRD